MRLTHAIFSALIALSLAMTPLASALASHDGAGMEDCNKNSADDCPCCDTKQACPPEFCLTKCFKVIGQVAQPGTLPVIISLGLRPSKPKRPPDWTYGPQPPPPRA